MHIETPRDYPEQHAGVLSPRALAKTTMSHKTSTIQSLVGWLIGSVLSWHVHAGLGGYRVLTSPQAGDGFGLGVEINARLAVEGVGAAAGDAFLVTCEAEHWQRDGDGDVDADLAGLDVFLKTGGCAPATGEDCNAISVLVCVDEFDSVVDCGDI